MKLKYVVFLLMLVPFNYSCTKSFLEQTNPNGVSVENGFQTENDIATGVNGVYQALRSSNCVGEGAALWTDDRADDINTTDNQSNNGEPFQFTAFSLVPSNSYLQNHWTALYIPISRANLILSIISKIPFASETTRNQYIAELKFIRAYMYYNLVREFGDVPLVTERLTSAEKAPCSPHSATKATRCGCSSPRAWPPRTPSRPSTATCAKTSRPTPCCTSAPTARWSSCPASKAA